MKKYNRIFPSFLIFSLSFSNNGNSNNNNNKESAIYKPEYIFSIVMQWDSLRLPGINVAFTSLIFFSKELGFCFFLIKKKKKDAFFFFSNEVNNICCLLQHQHHHIHYAWCALCATQQFWHEEMVMKTSNCPRSHILGDTCLCLQHKQRRHVLVLQQAASPPRDRGWILVLVRGRLWNDSSPLLHRTWVLLAPPWPTPKKEAPHAFPQHEGESMPLKSHWWAALLCFSSLKTHIWTYYCYWNKLWKAYDDCKQ